MQYAGYLTQLELQVHVHQPVDEDLAHLGVDVALVVLCNVMAICSVGGDAARVNHALRRHVEADFGNLHVLKNIADQCGDCR